MPPAQSAEAPTVSSVGAEKFSMFNLVTGLYANTSASTGSLMLDVGAQRGQFSRSFAGNGFEVLAFEASPPNFAELCEIVGQIPSITPVNVAVSDEDAGSQRFYYSEEFIGVNSLKVNSTHLSDEKYALVEMVRLSSYLGDRAADVRVIKTDIEGADLLALKGFDFNANRPELVVSEFGGRSEAFGHGVGDVVHHMRQFGYVAWCSNYDSGTGLPYSSKTGEQSSPRLRYFGEFDSCQNPNWGDLLFFQPEMLRAIVDGVSQFDFGGAELGWSGDDPQPGRS